VDIRMCVCVHMCLCDEHVCISFCVCVLCLREIQRFGYQGF